jgi:uncharacterized membrane protein YbhN (UPF0104 family)
MRSACSSAVCDAGSWFARHPLGLLDATSVVLLGYAANNVLPARLGELVRAGMLAERGAIPVAQALAITLLERILDAFVILGLTALAGALVGPSAVVSHVLSIGGVLIAIGGLGFTALALLPRFFISLTSRLAMLLLPRRTIAPCTWWPRR